MKQTELSVLYNTAEVVCQGRHLACTTQMATSAPTVYALPKINSKPQVRLQWNGKITICPWWRLHWGGAYIRNYIVVRQISVLCHTQYCETLTASYNGQYRSSVIAAAVGLIGIHF